MLLNLVRLKYRDQAYFLKVGSITASLTLGSSIGIDSDFNLGPGGNVVSPNLGMSYADRPTISYAPLHGEDFLKSVLSSISLEAILVMTQSGWSVERIFGLCLERVNNLYNASKASGPTPVDAPKFKKFKRLLVLFRKLQLTGDLEIGPEFDKKTNTQNLVLLFERNRVNSKVADELYSLLGLIGQNASERVRITTNFLNLKPNQITVRTRSIASILFYLSQNVEIPQEHWNAGLVTKTKTQDGELFDWDETPAGSMFKIKFSDSYPDHAYLAVSYRGVWFYIADNDLQSKSTFMLLMQLFDLQAGQTKFTGPTLTLPVR